MSVTKLNLGQLVTDILIVAASFLSLQVDPASSLPIDRLSF